jgi:putative lipoprotein
MGHFLVSGVVISAAMVLTVNYGGGAQAQKDAKAKTSKVTGTITFQGDAGFEADTVARVMLQDVSLADAPATKVSEQTIKDLKKFPIAFEIEYDPSVIQPRRTYALLVRIETKGRLDYINDTRVEVLSSGKPATDVKVRVIRVKK